MARARSPEKRQAILDAAVGEISENGLAATTAKIAQRAGIASGTLFTYFRNKEELLNELYVDLKSDVYSQVAAGFPHKGSLESRARHVWSKSLDWALRCPAKRKVSVQLNVSHLITPATRARAAAGRTEIANTLDEVSTRLAIRDLPPAFATAVMAAMQEAALELIAQQPKQRDQLVESTFQIFWRITR